MTEPSVEEIVAKFEACKEDMTDADIAVLVASWRERGEALAEFIDAAQYDAMMEGPKFKGWNRSQLDRALTRTRAALKDKP
jgi:hypothetical protein